jgi:hypothetical protein
VGDFLKRLVSEWERIMGYVIHSIGFSAATGPVRYWRIPDSQGAYVLGDDGSIYSRWRWQALGGRKGFGSYLCNEWRRLRPGITTDGYLLVNLKINGKISSYYVHQLVTQAAYGTPLPGEEVCHFDGVKTNCDWRNLRWDSRQSNVADRVRHGTDQRGDKSSVALLTWPEVREIRRRHKNGETRKSLSLKYGVTVSCIDLIVTHKRWVERSAVG